MDELTKSLMLKYGLLDAPTDEQIADWYEEVLHRTVHIPPRDVQEAIGEEVARDVFGPRQFEIHSDADTLEALLRGAGNKARHG